MCIRRASRQTHELNIKFHESHICSRSPHIDDIVVIKYNVLLSLTHLLLAIRDVFQHCSASSCFLLFPLILQLSSTFWKHQLLQKLKTALRSDLIFIRISWWRSEDSMLRCRIWCWINCVRTTRTISNFRLTSSRLGVILIRLLVISQESILAKADRSVVIVGGPHASRRLLETSGRWLNHDTTVHWTWWSISVL